MTTANLTWYVDRSRIVAYQDCPRKRWWSYHFGGKGIRKRTVALPLATGIAVHRALELFLLGTAPDVAITTALTDYEREVRERGLQGKIEVDERFIKEQKWMLACVMGAWFKHRAPKILEEYEVVAVEQEGVNKLTPYMHQMVRLDAVLRHKGHGGLEIFEIKTCSYANYDWQQQWERNVQILANTLALEEIVGERCEGVKIEGIVKGMRQEEIGKTSPFRGMKIQKSPFCYGYRSKDAFGNPLYEHDYQAGRAWMKVAIYDEEGMTPEKWVDTFTEKELDNLFIPVPAIRPVPDQMRRWERQTVAQEKRLMAGVREYHRYMDEGMEDEAERVLDDYFPLHDTGCKKYGGSCEFDDACFDSYIGADPIGSGLYEERQPHHDSEGSDV